MKSLGMDVKQFEVDFKSKETQAQLDQTRALAEEMGIHATPLILVNETTVIPGYMSKEELKAVITEPVTITQ